VSVASLTALYTGDELREMLKAAITAKQVLASEGGVQEVRQGERHTRFHPGNMKSLEAWIAELEEALNLRGPRRTSRMVVF
jgi:hypothetical protein